MAHGGLLPSWPVINAPFRWVTLLGAGAMHAQTQAGQRVLTQKIPMGEGADLSKAPWHGLWQGCLARAHCASLHQVLGGFKEGQKAKQEAKPNEAAAHCC
jgi:hypothetical protein